MASSRSGVKVWLLTYAKQPVFCFQPLSITMRLQFEGEPFGGFGFGGAGGLNLAEILEQMQRGGGGAGDPFGGFGFGGGFTVRC